MDFYSTFFYVFLFFYQLWIKPKIAISSTHLNVVNYVHEQLSFHLVTLPFSVMLTFHPHSGFRCNSEEKYFPQSQNIFCAVTSTLCAYSLHYLAGGPLSPCTQAWLYPAANSILHLWCAGPAFSAHETAHFYLYKVFIFARLPALCIPAISCQVWNGSPFNFTTASGKRKGRGEKITRCSILTWPLSE